MQTTASHDVSPGREYPIATGQWVAAALAFLAIVSIFYVLTYNSGVGYDACEFLVIGRGIKRLLVHDGIVGLVVSC